MKVNLLTNPYLAPPLLSPRPRGCCTAPRGSCCGGWRERRTSRASRTSSWTRCTSARRRGELTESGSTVTPQAPLVLDVFFIYLFKGTEHINRHEHQSPICKRSRLSHAGSFSSVVPMYLEMYIGTVC